MPSASLFTPQNTNISTPLTSPIKHPQSVIDSKISTAESTCDVSFDQERWKCDECHYQNAMCDQDCESCLSSRPATPKTGKKSRT